MTYAGFAEQDRPFTRGVELQANNRNQLVCNDL